MIIALCFPTTYTNSNSSKKSQFSATHSFSIAIHPINEQLCFLAFWASQWLEVQGWKQMCHSKVPLCPPSHPQLFLGKRNRETKTYLLDLKMGDPNVVIFSLQARALVATCRANTIPTPKFLVKSSKVIRTLLKPTTEQISHVCLFRLGYKDSEKGNSLIPLRPPSGAQWAQSFVCQASLHTSQPCSLC